MLTLIRLELYKMTRRLRSYIGFAALAALVALMVTGLKYGPPPVEHLASSMAANYTMVGSFVNASFVSWILLQTTMATFMPLFASLVSGDLVSGESNDGTLRMMLARSVNRTPVLLAKYAAGTIYAVKLVGFMGVAAYALGTLVFGQGGLLVFGQGLAVYSQGEGIVRLLSAYALAAFGMVTVATIAFFLSTIVNNSTGAVIGAVALTYISMAVGQIEYFSSIKPYLFTTHLEVWREPFVATIDGSAIVKSIGYLAAYVAVFLSGAVLAFSRKDILT